MRLRKERDTEANSLQELRQQVEMAEKAIQQLEDRIGGAEAQAAAVEAELAALPPSPSPIITPHRVIESLRRV